LRFLQSNLPLPAGASIEKVACKVSETGKDVQKGKVLPFAAARAASQGPIESVKRPAALS
jgi:hypothetical protein